MASPAAPHPSTPSPPELHLALPGLLWPQQAMQDMVFDLELPALSWLLGRGARHTLPAPDSTAWLAAVADLPAPFTLPAAALRTRAASHTRAQSGRWLCVDPIHLRVERTQLIVTDPATLQLDASEAAALMQELAPLLAELGELHIDAPHEWHLHLHAETNLRTTPLPEAIGLVGDSLMPQADNVRLWRRVLNEVQMALHTHPVNTARAERGLPTVNSLWPWGEGRLPQAPAHWDQICADGSLWQGLAAHSGAQYSPAPQQYNKPDARTFTLLTALSASAQARDAMQWREALRTLETQWFAPIQAELQAGRLRRFTLHGHGAGHALQASFTPLQRFYFWRRASPLTTLGVAQP